MRNIREEKIKNLERHLRRNSIKDRIVGLILRYVNSVVNMATVTITDDSIAPELHQVVTSQNRIGAVKMLQGFLSKEWVQAMEDYGEKHPNRRMTAILRGLWDELFEPIWDTRNHILHDLPNRYNDALDKSNEEKLQWYYDHRFEVLSFHDRKFAEHSKEKIQAMRGKTKRQWVRKLDRLRAIYEVELQQRQAGQQVLSKYFECTSPTKSPSYRCHNNAPRRHQQSLFDTTKIRVVKAKQRAKHHRYNRENSKRKHGTQRNLNEYFTITRRPPERDKPP
jgi:hypothetical protein